MDQKIIVYGSSIAWGAWDEEGGWVDRLKRYTSEKTVRSNEEYYCMLYNLGVSGDTSAGILQRFEKELLKRYNESDQSLVLLFEVGVNDSMYVNADKEFQVPKTQFKLNIEELLRISTKYTSKVAFIGGTPVIDTLLDPIPWHTLGTYKTSYVSEFNQILLDTCLEQGVLYIDIFSAFSKGDLKELMSPDGVHPSTKGHEVIYESAREALVKEGWV